MPLTLKNISMASILALPLFMTTVNAMTPTGSPVKKITSASSISGWHAVDPRRVVVSFSPTKNYLLTLRRDCHALNFAASVSVTTSNNTIYAGFDSVTGTDNAVAYRRSASSAKLRRKH